MVRRPAVYTAHAIHTVCCISQREPSWIPRISTAAHRATSSKGFQTPQAASTTSANHCILLVAKCLEFHRADHLWLASWLSTYVPFDVSLPPGDPPPRRTTSIRRASFGNTVELASFPNGPEAFGTASCAPVSAIRHSTSEGSRIDAALPLASDSIAITIEPGTSGRSARASENGLPGSTGLALGPSFFGVVRTEASNAEMQRF